MFDNRDTTLTVILKRKKVNMQLTFLCESIFSLHEKPSKYKYTDHTGVIQLIELFKNTAIKALNNTRTKTQIENFLTVSDNKSQPVQPLKKYKKTKNGIRYKISEIRNLS